MSVSPADALTSVPNLLSLSRLPLTVGLCGCISAHAWVLGLAVFAVAAVTDWLDGWWARRFGRVSVVGRSLDPLTDKVLLGGAFIFLIPVTQAGITPWVVAVVIGRELLVTGLRGMVEATGAKFGADWFGKLKTVLQCATVAAVLGVEAVRADGRAADALPALEWGRDGLVWVMLGATVGSGVQYVVKAARVLRPADET
ncbi:MAG: CDP-alcohol phosphatidyltransferase family protein [Gemmataceae bacterium]